MSGRSRLGDAFARAKGRTGLVPFVTAGYPSLEASLDMLRGFDRLGAIAAEIGIPFSDPIADGADIQRASEWALARGTGLAQTLQLVADLRRSSDLPLVLMSYVNPVLRGGVEDFARAAGAAGVDGVLLSDLPPDEGFEVWEALDRGGLDTVVLVAPTTDEARLPRLLARARGFVYCLARTGVTGTGPGHAGALPERVAALKRRTSLPVAVGFGISSPSQARALKDVADAVVVGAAFMRAVAEDPRHGAADRVLGLADALIEALA
jgi:tryptophan synthase alpha chain